MNFLSSHKSITIIVSIIMTFQLMTAVALDFCAEELELRGGREVGRYFCKHCLCLSFNKRFKNFFFRKDDLSVLESGECQSLIQVCFIIAG